MSDRLFRTSTACLASLVVCGVSCGGDSRPSTQGLSAGQMQFASFLPNEYVLDLRESGAGDVERRSPNRFGMRLGEGWSAPDSSGRWALGDRSTVLVHLAEPAARNLVFEYRSPGVDSITVSVNEVDVGQLPSVPTWHTQFLTVPDGVLTGGANRVELRYTAGPQGFPFFADDGWRSVYFRTLGVIESEEATPLPESAGLPTRDDGTLTIGQSGTLLVPYPSDRALASVTVTMSGDSRPWRPSEFGLRYWAAGADDPEAPAAMARASLGGVWGRTSASLTLPLDGRAGPGCVLVDADPASSDAPLQLDLLEAEELPPVTTLERERPSEAPDIVLVVLDAARADHVGAYGYPKPTSPNIDRLSEDSLLFGSVFATAPYTLSSMTTMLTGLSFVQHGVTGREHQLPGTVTTLAEHLKEAGYRTSCLSANPNNSVALGLNQGCDVFEEFWQNAQPPASLDPYRVSRRAIDELDVSEAPLFLMLHYVPPHEPYAPPSEFDIFGDENYGGAYEGSWETIRAIDDGTLEPTQADLDELVSLYDGNLRTGDDALGVVLDSLRRRARWNQTVVLVTSDHGEAFGEHGRMGHNTTVYDEMVHVPFVLRVPDDWLPDAVDTASLASLADVTPTLLGLAGVESRGRLYGQDLLAPRVTGERRVVSRSGGSRPMYGYRTQRWKAILGRNGEGELYDVAADPDEQTDRYVEHPGTFACLDALLRLEVSGAIEASAEAGEPELSEEELRTLRSLGYVR